MLQLVLFLLTTATASILQAQRFGINTVWPSPFQDNGSANTLLNLTASGGYSQAWAGFMWTPRTTKTLAKIYQNVTVTGSLGANDFCAALFTEDASVPNTEIQNRCTLDAAISSTMVAVNGFTSSVSGGTTYAIVFRNANASPTANYPAIANFSNVSALDFGIHQTSAVAPSSVRFFISTNGGASWSGSSRIPCTVIEYSDGSREGFPCINMLSSTVYGGREQGVQFTTPNQPISVQGACGLIAKTGTLTSGSLTFKIWRGAGTTGKTAIATSASLPANRLPGSKATICRWFNSSVVLQANSTYSLVVSLDSGSASDYVYFSIMDILPSLGSVLLWPGSTSLSSVLSIDAGANWTITSNRMAALWFTVDPTPVQVPSGFSQ